MGQVLARGGRVFPDLGPPLLLIALDGAGALLGALPLTQGPRGPIWPASPLGDEHDVRIRDDQPAQPVVSALLRSVPREMEPGETVLTDVRPGGLLTHAAAGRIGCPAPVVDPGFPEFLADAGSALAAEGRCLLACLNLDGESLAQALFFRFSGADLLYMSTYQSTAARYSPSHLLLAQAAQMAVADGVRNLELGRGDEPYKFRLGAQPRYLRNVAMAPVP